MSRYVSCRVMIHLLTTALIGFGITCGGDNGQEAELQVLPIIQGSIEVLPGASMTYDFEVSEAMLKVPLPAPELYLRYTVNQPPSPYDGVDLYVFDDYQHAAYLRDGQVGEPVYGAIGLSTVDRWFELTSSGRYHVVFFALNDTTAAREITADIKLSYWYYK